MQQAAIYTAVMDDLSEREGGIALSEMSPLRLRILYRGAGKRWPVGVQGVIMQDRWALTSSLVKSAQQDGRGRRWGHNQGEIPIRGSSTGAAGHRGLKHRASRTAACMPHSWLSRRYALPTYPPEPHPPRNSSS